MAIVKLRKEHAEIIYPDQISDRDIVVGKSDSLLIITNLRVSPTDKTYTLTINPKKESVNFSVTNNEFGTPLDRLVASINNGHTVAAFPEKDWKQALQWLIDNA